MPYALIERYVNRLLTESTPDKPLWNMEQILQGKKAHWNYIDGCMMTSLWQLWLQTEETQYRDFVYDYMDYYVNSNGVPLAYTIEEYNIDNINMGRVLFDLPQAEKYDKAIALLHEQLATHPRIPSGNFWHKQIYPNQIWLDGLYMAQVFYTRWALAKHDKSALEDMCRQFEFVQAHLYLPELGLYCHGYDDSKSIFWADATTGRSQNVWLRAMGWFAVALADILEYLADFPDYEARLRPIFIQLMEGIARYADAETGMYWQVVNEAAREGNYLETSGSAMISFAMLKGARLGILPESYRSLGKKTFDGICQTYLSEGEHGLNLGGICLVAGLGPADNLRRDGSYAYYISEPIVENDAKGVAPFLMAYTEIKRLR